jgi:hypothetical protein
MPRLERLPFHPGSALLTLYRGATQLGAPLIVAALKRRAARAKENPVRVPERLGQASAPRPAGPLLWLHGASVGESLAILPLLTALLAARPALQVLISTGTVTSARLLGERLPARARHQFAPVDHRAAGPRLCRNWPAREAVHHSDRGRCGADRATGLPRPSSVSSRRDRGAAGEGRAGGCALRHDDQGPRTAAGRSARPDCHSRGGRVLANADGARSPA